MRFLMVLAREIWVLKWVRLGTSCSFHLKLKGNFEVGIWLWRCLLPSHCHFVLDMLWIIEHWLWLWLLISYSWIYLVCSGWLACCVHTDASITHFLNFLMFFWSYISQSHSGNNSNGFRNCFLLSGPEVRMNRVLTWWVFWYDQILTCEPCWF